MKRIEEEKGSNATGTDSVDLQEAVRRRAYQIYEERGMGPGLEVDDWLQAEAELLVTQRPRTDTVRPQKDIQRTEKAA